MNEWEKFDSIFYYDSNKIATRGIFSVDKSDLYIVLNLQTVQLRLYGKT